MKLGDVRHSGPTQCVVGIPAWGDGSPQDSSNISYKRRRNFESKHFADATVVVIGTLEMACDIRTAGRPWSNQLIVVNEAAQSSEPMTLIPIHLHFWFGVHDMPSDLCLQVRLLVSKYYNSGCPWCCDANGSRSRLLVCYLIPHSYFIQYSLLRTFLEPSSVSSSYWKAIQANWFLISKRLIMTVSLS